MLKLKSKSYVFIKHPAYSENNAFTLLEMLLSLSIVFVMCSIFPLVIQNISIFKSVSTDNYDINFELCLKDILTEITNKQLTIKNGDLIAKENDKKFYSYTFHNNRIVRRLNDSGYTILMENVKAAQFKQIETHYYLEIEWQGHRRMRHEIIRIE